MREARGCRVGSLLGHVQAMLMSAVRSRVGAPRVRPKIELRAGRVLRGYTLSDLEGCRFPYRGRAHQLPLLRLSPRWVVRCVCASRPGERSHAELTQTRLYFK